MIRNRISFYLLIASFICCFVHPGFTENQARRRLAISGTAESLSVKIKDADLRDFLLVLAEIGHINLILGPEVKGKVTLSLNNVTWREALDAALFFNDMGYIEISSNGIVGSYDKMKSMVGKLEEALMETTASTGTTDELLKLSFPMTFDEAKSLYNEIFPLLSIKGKYQYNNDTHCAQVIDLKVNALKIMDLISLRVGKHQRRDDK